MVVLGVEVDPEEVGQPSSTLRTRQEHVRERTSVRRGPTWAVCRERTFAVRSVRQAILQAEALTQTCLARRLDLAEIIPTGWV